VFTGIVQKRAQVTRVAHDAGGLKLALATEWRDLDLGESIAVDGVCLTVTEFTADGEAEFFLSQETLAKTSLARLSARAWVNLERALTPQTRLSGHYVQGHVDGLGTITALAPAGESIELQVELARSLSRYCVEKGSIALNGVSLTINRLEDRQDTSIATLMIIPHTWEHTNLSTLAVGDQLNVEVDILAKYVERLCRPSN